MNKGVENFNSNSEPKRGGELHLFEIDAYGKDEWYTDRIGAEAKELLGDPISPAVSVRREFKRACEVCNGKAGGNAMGNAGPEWIVCDACDGTGLVDCPRYLVRDGRLHYIAPYLDLMGGELRANEWLPVPEPERCPTCSQDKIVLLCTTCHRTGFLPDAHTEARKAFGNYKHGDGQYVLVECDGSFLVREMEPLSQFNENCMGPFIERFRYEFSFWYQQLHRITLRLNDGPEVVVEREMMP